MFLEKLSKRLHFIFKRNFLTEVLIENSFIVVVIRLRSLFVEFFPRFERLFQILKVFVILLVSVNAVK